MILAATRLNMLKFAATSAAIHTLILAPWPAPILPDYRAEAVLSVALERRPTNLSVPTRRPEPAHTANKTATRTTKAERMRPATLMPTVPKRNTRIATPKNPAHEVVPMGMTVIETALSRPSPENGNAVLSASPPWWPSAVTEYMPARERLPPVLESNTALKTTDKTIETARALIRGRLETDLARYFSYPAIARRRGWQGNVRVGFTVQPDGRVTDAYVAHSSGYEVLDKSALKALGTVEPLAEAAAWLEGKAVDMQLPVIYKLEEP